MSDRDDMPTPEEWPTLKAEWTHDYGLRFLEDRQVRYEDTAERPLDQAAVRGEGGEQDDPIAANITQRQATVTPPGHAATLAAQPPHPWPSEIAEANRQKQPGQDHSRNNGQERGNGRDGGHSM